MSTVEEQLAWCIDAFARGPEVTRAELEARAHLPSFTERFTIDDALQTFHTGGFERQITRPFTVENTRVINEHQAEAVLVVADGKRWAVTCWVADEPPHGMTSLRILPAPPPGTTVRDAAPDDAAALADLERRAPIRLGANAEVLMYFDRGDDYFAQARLMDDVTIYVAEVDGEVAGVYWGAQQQVRIEGSERKLFLEMHVRIDPETRRGGVHWAMATYGRDRYSKTADSISFWVSPENHAIRKFLSGIEPWAVQGARVLLPCEALASGGDPVRATTVDDADEVARILNECHGRSELFVPYTVDSLQARLGRSPDQYDWTRVLHADGAVVGAGHQIVSVWKSGAEEHKSRRAQVLDHGFVPGAEDGYRALLGAWSARAAKEGATHLALFTSIGSPTYEVLSSLAEEVEVYDFWTFNFPSPAGLAERGVYVDPVYF